VPRPDREAWRREWQAEFAHFEQPGAGDRRPDAFRRLAMAFRHAWWLRWHPREAGALGGSSVLDQLQQAVRALLRERSFTIPALVTLALGIGANVAVFSVVEAVLLRPLPYPSVDRLVLLRHRDQRTNLTKANVASTDVIDIAQRQQTLEAVVSYNTGRTTLYGMGEPVDARALQAGAALFDVTGARPHLGRGLTADDCRQGAAPVVILGYEFWRAQFAGDPAVVGRSIQLGAATREVIGIAPPNFTLPPQTRTDVVVPLTLPAQAPVPRTIGNWIFAAARTRAGATIESADAELRAISARLGEEFPATNRGTEYYGVTVREALVGDAGTPLVLLMAAVAVVLLIALVNVGNLLLVRSIARRGELAIRVALGAGRRRLVSQLLAENLLLAGAAAILGVLLAGWGTSALVALVPSSVNVPALAEVGVNATVLAFAVLITIGAAVAFSLFAAAHLGGNDAAAALVSRTRHTMSKAARRTASTLVVVEVALAVVLLVGAGLVLRSFAALLSVDPGFDRRDVTTVTMQLPAGRYNPPEARQAFYTRLLPALEALPGVERVGAAAVVPLTGNNWTTPFERTDRPVAPGQRPPDIGWQQASRGYFEALRIPLKAGRSFAPEDAAGQPVVMISEAVASRFFPSGETAVGHRVKVGNAEAEIVGVVGDIRRGALTEEPRADMYISFERGVPAGTTLFIRAKAGQSVSFEGVRAAIRGIEPNSRVEPAESMDEITAESAGATRLVMWLLSAFGAVALALAAIGVYGVLAYAVRQRTREFGTRLALGATRSAILGLVLRQGAAIALIGVTVGLAVSLLATRALGSLLFSVAPSDPITLTATAGLLIVVTFAACYLPARRAARVEPSRIFTETA
jgi:putative ABC transport system permease protein